MSREPKQPAVYTFKDSDGQPLYVGHSLQVLQKILAHRSKAWWPEVASVEIDHFDLRDEAREYEALLIAELDPPHNQMHRDWPEVEGTRCVRFYACGSEAVGWFPGGPAGAEQLCEDHATGLGPFTSKQEALDAGRRERERKRAAWEAGAEQRRVARVMQLKENAARALAVAAELEDEAGAA